MSIPSINPLTYEIVIDILDSGIPIVDSAMLWGNGDYILWGDGSYLS